MVKTPQTDDLHARMTNRETEALAEAFAAHRPRLWRLVNFRMDPRLRGRVDPDDILQEAFLAAEKRLEHYGGDGFRSPFLWLRVVTRQTMIDVHRRHLGSQMRSADREVSVFLENPTATSASLAVRLVGDWTSPSQAAARGETYETVRTAIASMEPIDREVLALRHFEELTNGEVAAELGISPKAASIRYVRALKRLKEILAQAPYTPDE